MIDEKKLLSVLCELGKNTQQQIKAAERNPEEAMLEFALKNQLAMLHGVIGKIKEQYKIGEWIPCSERLPEERINPVTSDFYEYQVTYKSDSVTDVRHYKFGRGHWWNGGGTIDEYVTAWRERPEAYKERDEDENR